MPALEPMCIMRLPDHCVIWCWWCAAQGMLDMVRSMLGSGTAAEDSWDSWLNEAVERWEQHLRQQYCLGAYEIGETSLEIQVLPSDPLRSLQELYWC